MDYAMDDYLNSVPEEITAEVEIDFYGSYYGSAVSNIETVREALLAEDMVIADGLRQQNVEVAMNDFLDELEYFLSMYNEAALFYSSDAYKEDVDAAYELDGVVIEAYYGAAYAQLALIDLIDEYQSDLVSDFDENTDNPLEKIGISMSLLYDEADAIVYELSYWDMENPDIDGIEALYDSLIAVHAEEAKEVADLYDDVYVDVFEAFEVNYLGVLTSFEEGVAVLIEDGRAGLVTEETTADYDYIFNHYDDLIDLHNSIVDMLYNEY